MGDVISFRSKRLSGFIPDEIEVVPVEFRHSNNHQCGRSELIGHARSGAPTINLAEPFTGEGPIDTDPRGAA